jgi:hypothetical protein
MMLSKAMAPGHRDYIQKLPSNPTHKMQSKHLQSILSLLRDKMGMNHKAASEIANRASKHHPPTAYISTFIHAAVEEQINVYRKQSFAKFGLMISVYPSPKATRMQVSLEHFGKITVGYHSYVFHPNHNEAPAKVVHVRLSQGSIQVYFCGSWHPISAYLDEVNTDWTYPECMELQLDRQYEWWTANGKSFEITTLPGEIRNAIFDFVFPSQARPFPTSKCRNNDHLAPTFQCSYTALMRTNNQLRQEASDRFYRTTTFSIEHALLLDRTLRNDILRNRLRRVRLSLDHSQYLDLFSSKPWVISHEPYVNRQLRKMSNLESLEIHFRAPSRIATKTWLEGACQKTAINMIIDAAWPSIKCLPVVISGYVKDSQKKEIEARVQSERDAYAFFEAQCRAIGKHCSLPVYDAWIEGEMAEEKEQGGVRLDGEPWAAVDAGESEALQWNCMSNQDLREIMWCTCEERCSLDTWDPAN